jgi:hypothetical protein
MAGVAGVAGAGNANGPGRVRRLERRLGEAGAEEAALSRARVRVGRLGRRLEEADVGGARDLLRERVGSVRWVGDNGESDCSSQTLTVGDSVPVPGGSEYTKERN